MPRLLIYDSDGGSRVFELLGDRPISIGRAKSSNLVLDDESVSRLHAVVRSTPDGHWQIIDRGSSNGVKINGSAAKEAMLRPNDEILVGECRLRFEDSATHKVASYGTPKLPQRVIQVLSQSSYASSAMPVEALGAVATHEAGRAADAGARRRGAEHENRLLALLDRAQREFGKLNTAEDVTRGALDLVLEIEGAERAYAMLLDEASMARGDLRKGGYTFLPAVIRYRGASGPPNQAAPQLVISQSIIKQVMQAGLPRLVSDAKADSRLSASSSIALAGIQSAMCAPLGIGDRLRGLLYVDNLSRRGMFTVEDLNVFSVVAVQAGLAIDRVRGRGEMAKVSQ
jgi:FHA domain-containing protein/GAF domain-containing protein